MNLLGCNSKCESPEKRLLEAVRNNDRYSLEDLLKIHPLLKQHVYEEEGRRILTIASSLETTKGNTIQSLIDCGCDLYYSNEVDLHWQPLHFAASTLNKDVLETIIKNLKPGRINDLANRNNALHILIKYGDHNKQPQFLDCLKILVSKGIDVNQGDSKNVSPILWAAKKKYSDVVTYLLTPKAEVDIDSHKLENKTARDYIKENNLFDGELNNFTFIKPYNDEEKLFIFIHERNEDAFVDFKNGLIKDLCNIDDSYETLLQSACEKGLKRAVKHLLDNEADPNKILEERNKRPPIEIAVKHGYYEILSYLLKKTDTKITSKCIIDLFKFIDSEKFPDNDHEKCYDILREVLLKKRCSDKINESTKEDFDINEPDQINNSALHYAVRYADSQKILDLLDLGASLASKNSLGIMPIEDMKPKQLEAHLDSCIELNEKDMGQDSDNFSVTFKYRSLLPPRKRKGNTNVEEDPTNFTDFRDETEVVYYMSQSLEFKYLLQHPVIVTFLYMKWRRIQWLSYVNLFFYFAFVASLVTYILNSYTSSDVESNSLSIVSYMLLWFTFLILTLREICKLISLCKMQNIDNYIEAVIEVVLIIVTACILYMENASFETKRQICSVVSLLSCFELILMLGQVPILATNVAMFKKVSHNFFNFFFWCLFIILAFALSFHMLFSQDEENLFTDLGKSIFKTIIMLTGEFDASSLDFKSFPLTSMIIFTLFIFLVVIILMNLAVGITVSDTQQIKNEAELVGYISRVQYIRYIECVLCGNTFASRLLKLFQLICCRFNFPAGFKSAFFSLLDKRVLFQHYDDYEFEMFPNKGGKFIIKILKNNSLNSQYIPFEILYLDSNIVKKSKAIIKKRREEKHQFSLEKSVIELQKHQFFLEKSAIELKKMFNEMKQQIELLYESIINKS